MKNETGLTTTTPPQQAVTRALTVPVPVPSTARTMDALLRGSGCTDPIPDGPLRGCSRTMVDMMRKSVAIGAPDEEVYRLIVYAIQYNLNPLEKELWCVNMAGKDQPPQWTVTPSRDGYLRAMRRNPTIKDFRSSLVRDGDDFSYDARSGEYQHRSKPQKTPGAIYGAYCAITMTDGTKHVDFCYTAEVKRPTPVWDKFWPQMTEKSIQKRLLHKVVGLSDLYISDRAFDIIEAEHADAFLVDPSESTEYLDGFALGGTRTLPPATITPPAEIFPDGRGPRAEGVAAFNDRIKVLLDEVEGAIGADALEARTQWLKAVDHSPLSRQERDDVWSLVDMLAEEQAVADFKAQLLVAREARWKKEALVREQREAGAPVPTATAPADPGAHFPPDLWGAARSALGEGLPSTTAAVLIRIVAARFPGRTLVQLDDQEVEVLAGELQNPKQLEALMAAIEDDGDAPAFEPTSTSTEVV